MVDGKRLLAGVLRRSLALALLLLSACALALAERRERVNEAWRPVHYDVSVTLDDKLTQITSARAAINISVTKGPLDKIDLDFGELSVDSVTVGGVGARFTQGGGRLNVMLPQPASRNAALTLVVNYHGRPADGLILKTDKDGKPSATGDNWPDRVHHWIPCLDHPSAKATVSFTVTAPARETVVANGLLTSTRDNPDATKTWTYTEARPISPYCMVIAVGEYARSEPSTKTVTPLAYYVPQSDRGAAVRGFSSAPATLEFFSQTVGPYPYEKLALIVGATRFGGMENASAIVLSGNLFNTPVDTPPLSRRFNIRRGLVQLTGHEVAHQWFGDSVAIKTWADIWLSEGFATYFSGLFVERHDGREAFREYMREAAGRYFDYERVRLAPLYDTETEDLFKLLNRNSYQKGAWVLHMLRGMMGDDAFFRGIRGYYRAHEHRTASTEDLRAALERAWGKSLKEFFAQWVYGGGHPRYEASWSWHRTRGRRGGALTVRVQQTQAGAPFLTPLAIEVVTARGAQRRTLTPTGRDSLLRIPFARRPSDVRIDPDEMVLKELVWQHGD